MSSHFHQAILEYNETNRGHPQYECWLNYALSTNERGSVVVAALKRYVLSIKSKRLLDIGCGYGGACIAAAQAGARAVGVDLDAKLLEFAEINRKDHPGLAPTFDRMDILDWEAVQKLGQFDLISCDNVIEHVASPERLVRHIRELLTKSGFAYLSIPNASSLGQVLKDSHYGLPAICLLQPQDAAIYVQHALGQPCYDVSVYYNFDQYNHLFSQYGLSAHLINACRIERDSLEVLSNSADQIRVRYSEWEKQGKIPPTLTLQLREMLEQYLHTFEQHFQDYVRLPEGKQKQTIGRRLMRDYRDEVWYVIVARSSLALYSRIALSRLKGGIRRVRKLFS